MEVFSNTSNNISVGELLERSREWKAYIMSRWWLLFIAGILGSGLGAFYALRTKAKYTAITTFVLEGGESNNMSQYAGVASMVGIDLYGSANGGVFQPDNIVELYKSRTMLGKTLLSKTYEECDELLIDRYIDIYDYRAKWKDDPLLKNFKFNAAIMEPKQIRIRDSLITTISNKIRDNMLIVEKIDKKSSIVKVELISEDEHFSKSFNDQLVSHVNSFYLQTKTAKSNKNIAILQHKVDSIKSEMVTSLYTAASVMDATPNINPIRQVQRVVPSQQAQFTAESNKVILGQLTQNLEMSKMTLLQEQPLIQLVDPPVYPLQKTFLSVPKALIIGGFVAVFIFVLGISLKFFLKP